MSSTPSSSRPSVPTREALLDAAVGLLDEHGPAGVTLRAVGAAAGVSRSAPYRHFADKVDLMRAVAARSMTAITELLVAAQADPDPGAGLRGALGGYYRFAVAHPHRYRLVYAQIDSDGADPRLPVAAELHRRLVDLTAAAAPGRDAPAVAAMLLASVHGIADLTLSGHLTVAKWGVDGATTVDHLVRSVLPTC